MKNVLIPTSDNIVTAIFAFFFQNINSDEKVYLKKLNCHLIYNKKDPHYNVTDFNSLTKKNGKYG